MPFRMATPRGSLYTSIILDFSGTPRAVSGRPVRPARIPGQGIGKALLKHLAGLAVERGCGRVEWLVLDWNERAKKFYRQLGSESLDDYVVFRLTGDKLAEFAG